jgi:hypothetical protein
VTPDEFRRWSHGGGSELGPETVARIDRLLADNQTQQRLEEIDRALRLYGGITAVLIVLIAPPFFIVGVATWLLAYNQGHVRPLWAAALLGLLVTTNIVVLAFFAGRKYDALEKERRSLGGQFHGWWPWRDW